MQDIQLDDKKKAQLDGNIKKMLEGGATEDDIMKYASDFKNQFGQKKNLVSSQSSAIPSQLPKVGEQVNPLQQGANIVGGGVIGEISKTVPRGSIKEAALADKKKNESYLGALWNNVVGSAARLAGGATRAAYQFSGNPVVIMERDLLDKAGQAIGKNLLAAKEKEYADVAKGFIERGRTSASSKEYEKKLAEGFDVTDGIGVSDLKGLGTMIPQFVADMGLAVGTGGSSFAIQGYDDALSMVDEMPEASNISEGTRVAFGIGGALVVGALEKLGLDNLIKNPAAKKYVTAKVIKEATDELVKKGVKVTAEQFERTVKEKAAKLTAKELTKIAAKRGLKSAAIEGGTEAVQEGGMDLLKLAANKIEGKEIFDEEEMKDTAAKRYLNSLAAGGVLGGIAGAGVSRFQNTQNAIKDRLKNVKTVEDIDAIVAEINDNVADGTMTQEEAENVLPIVQNFVEVSQKVPETLIGKNKVEAVDLISEREKIGEQLKQIEEQKAALDPAFHKNLDEDARQLEERANEINNELAELAKPENNVEEVVAEEEIQQPIELSPDLPEGYEMPIQAIEEQPELVEAVRVEQEPETKEGVKVVTLSGMVEEDRVRAVEERKKKTTLTEKESLHNNLIDLANRADKARGNEKTNLQGQIRQRVRELNAKLGEELYKYDGVSVRAKVKSKTKGERYLKIKGTTRDTSGRAIKEDAVLLFDRSPELVEKYEQLADSPNITALQVDSGNGVTMTAEQIEAALQDIADGIPSVQADNLLNALEEGFNRGYFDLRGKDIGQDRVQASVEDFIGVQQEEVGQPMDEDELQKYLEEQAELPIEEEEDLNDLINQYEQQPRQIDISGKVQSPNPTSEKRSSPEIQPTKEGKGNGSPKAEVGKQPIGEAESKKEDVEENVQYDNIKEPPPPKTPTTQKEGEEGGSKKQKRLGILNRLMKSENVSEANKKLLEENGLNYEVSSQPEAQQLAKEMVDALGVDAALEAARSELIDPSVGSAVFAESLNTLFNQENDLRLEGKIEEANAVAEMWADVSYEYAEISNKKGKWNSQIAYFYKTSPMGFVMRIQESRAEQFKKWFAEKEEGYKEVFDIIKESEEFADILKGEVEKSRVAERKTERAAKKQKVYKKIDDWADKWTKKLTPATTQGKDIQQQGMGVPEVMKAAAELAKKLYDAGSSVANIVEDVALYVQEKLGDNIDLDELKSSLSDLVGDFEAKENALVDSLKRRKEELERRIREKDFSAEEYKEKRELTEKEKQAKEEYDAVKKEYDEARKSSKEYLDKKAKQYLTQLRKKLSGLSEEKKEEIVRRSIKKIIDSGGLEYDDFKEIVSNVMGLGKLSPEQIKEIESLTEKANEVDQIELDYVQNPTKEGLDKFVKAKQRSLEANRKLFELTHNEADITGTVKSIMTLNLLNLATVTANYFQNAIYQGLVRFPTSVIVNGIEYGKYGASLLGNRIIGTKVINPQTNPIEAQKGYWKEYTQGLIRGWEQTIKGVDEKDYFSSNQYAANLNPLKSYQDLVSSMKGDLQLSSKQKVDKFLQSTIGVQAYAISRLMTLGDKPPRYAAQGAEAIQIGTNELNLTNPLELEAFINTPERFSYNYFVKQGMSPKDAGLKSKELTKRIVDAGAKAVFQNENLLNFYLSKIDEASKIKEEDRKIIKGAKTFVSLGKAYTLPFVKTPANIWWAYFKVNNPALTFAKGVYELYEASVASKKGNFVEANRLRKQSNESIALAVIGYGFAVAAMALYQKGLVRPSNDDEDKAREKTAETFFGSDNKLNLGKFLGGDDYWVDLTWFPALGAVIDTQANLLEDKKKRGEDVSNADYNFLEDLLPNLKYSSIASLNSLVFDNGTRILDGLRKGGNYGETLLVDMVNRATGTVVGSTFQRASSLALPHKVDTKADGIMERISNNIKEKNAIVRMFTDMPKAKISIWGEPIKQDNSAFGILRTMFKIEKGSSDKFGLILYDDFQRTGDTKFLPPYENAKITHNGKQVELNTEQKRDLDIFVGQARKNIVAPFISDAAKLDGFDNYYSKLSDSEKVDALDVLYKQAKKIGYAKFQEKYTEFANADVDFEAIMQDAEKEFKKKALEFSISNQ